MAQHTITSNLRALSISSRFTRWQITHGQLACWKMRMLRGLALPLVLILLAYEWLRDAISKLRPQAATRRYCAGRLALGFYGETQYLVFWTGQAVYVRPVGRYGVLNKAFAGQAQSMFEALLVAQNFLGERQ